MILFPTIHMFDRILSDIIHNCTRHIHVVLLTSVSASWLTAVPCLCCGEERRSPVIEKRVERVLREQAYKSGVAGMAFGMVQNGSTICECYTGYASWEDKMRVDSSTVFNWASLSKGLTAVCALKMAEQGRLSLDSDIEDYLPELSLQNRVTLRQLLSMQGGIGGYEEYPELLGLKTFTRDTLTQQVILEKLAGKHTVFKPGSQLGYSSPAFILLSIAMEREAQKPFSEIVDDIVAKPLNLSSLHVGNIRDEGVVSYRVENGERKPIEKCNNDWRLGAGAVKSNLPDALSFASSLIQSSILTPKSSKELFERRAFIKQEGDDGVVIAVTYGFLRVGAGHDATIVATGEQPGVKSLLVIYPQQQMASVIFANTTPVDLGAIQLKVMKALLEK